MKYNNSNVHFDRQIKGGFISQSVRGVGRQNVAASLKNSHQGKQQRLATMAVDQGEQFWRISVSLGECYFFIT
jgi:hypothetical protein